MEAIGDTSVPLPLAARQIGKLGSEWSTHGAELDHFIFGQTPLRRAIEEASARFLREWFKLMAKDMWIDRSSQRSWESLSALVIISDGKSTDGDPAPQIMELRSKGVTIVSCVVTDRDVQEAGVLPSRTDRRWDKSTRRMFDYASMVSGSIFAERFRAYGWSIREGSRFFVQINQSSLLDKFINVLLG
jgi:hypothetical protein